MNKNITRFILTVLEISFVLLLLPACKRQYDLTGYPWNEDTPESYIWVAENANLFFEIDSFFGGVGLIQIDGEQIEVVIEGDAIHNFIVTENTARTFIYHDDGSCGFCPDGEQILYAFSPKYKEGEFTIRVPLKFGQLYAGKKITFTRYEKDAVQPSNFGFDLESWDDLVTHFELVDADTGETVSLDVLK